MVTDVIIALKTTCIKNVEFKIIIIRTGCQYVRYCYSESLNWATQNHRLDRGSDIVAAN